MTLPLPPIQIRPEPYPVAAGQRPGLGCIIVSRGDMSVATPLEETSVEVTVDRFRERTRITHAFANRGFETIECVFVGILPFGAAIDELELQVGDRKFLGQVEKRQDARRRFEEAKATGRRTALLELDEDDVGTLSIGTVRAGERVTITIAGTRPLALKEGSVEVRVPLVLGTRFLAGNIAPVPTPNALPLAVRPATGLRITARLQGLEIEQLTCTQHAVVTSLGEAEITVTLANQREIPNRDFVLRFVPRTTVPVLAVLVDSATGPHDRAVAIHVALPLDFTGPEPLRRPRDLVLLVDRSGSMQGTKMAAAKRATRVALRGLEEGDRFCVIAFDDVVEAPSAEGLQIPALLPYSQGAFDRADAFLAQVEARGGTEIGRALAAAVGILGTVREGRDAAIVLLTDGQVQGLDQVLTELGSSPPVVLALGIDDASNVGALARIAEQSGGESRWVGPGEDVEAAIEDLVATLDVARLSSLELLAEVSDGTRTPLAEPVGLARSLRPGIAKVVLGKVPLGTRGLLLSGVRGDGTRFTTSAPAVVDSSGPGAIGKLWAAAMLSRGRGVGLSEETAVALALEHGILSREVALVLVGDQVQDGGGQRRIDVVVASPSQWDMAAPLIARCGGALPPPTPLGMPAPAAESASMPLPVSRPQKLRARAFDAQFTANPVAGSTKGDGTSDQILGEQVPREAVRDLLASQRADGSFGDGSLLATISALRTLLAHCGSPTKRVRKALEKARKFLKHAIAIASERERSGAQETLAALERALA